MPAGLLTTRRMHAVVRLHWLSVDANTAGLGGILYAVARSALDALGEIFVDAQQHLAFFYVEMVVFPKIAAILAEVGFAEILLDFGVQIIVGGSEI